jgi:hypothetical protein
MLEQTDDSRIETVLAFAESALPLDQIATGAGDESGLGLKFKPHSALDWLLQALERFPGRGWRLIATGLQSPVVRNRNMALKAFIAWPREAWPAEANPVLEKAMTTETKEDLRNRLGQLLRQHSSR